MFLEKLALNNFRNLANQKLDFKNSINIFYGDNAQGKTNLIEAIYLLSVGRSFRTRADHELISWGAESAKISGKADILELEMTIFPNQKKLQINKQERRLTELIGTFLVVLFTPAEIEIVGGSPDRRRSFLDQLASKLSRDYLISLAKYQRLLRTRNSLLWQIKNGKKLDLVVWNEQLASLAVTIWQERYQLIEQLGPTLKANGQKLLAGELKVIYEPLIKLGSTKVMKEQFLGELARRENEEIRKSLTLIGPQRDDFKVILDAEKEDKVVSKDLTIYGSRGEQRSAVICLKLSEIEILEQVKETRPTLLLDEVLGELDQKHQKLLLSQIKKGQAFLTTANFTELGKLIGSGYQSFEVKDGQIL